MHELNKADIIKLIFVLLGDLSAPVGVEFQPGFVFRCSFSIR